MKKLIVFVSVCIAFHSSSALLSDEEYVQLPPVFHMDNYDKCMLLDEKALYCSITYEAEPLDRRSPSETWQLLERARNVRRYYRHDRIRHWICVPFSCPNISKDLYVAGYNNSELTNELNACYNAKYERYGITGNITWSFCEGKEAFFQPDSYDYAVLFFFAAFIAFVLFATGYDCFALDHGDEQYKAIMGTTFGKVMLAFSIRNNYKRLIHLSNDEDSTRLRCIQGIRFYSTILVIMAHVCMVNFAIPVTNTKFNEDSTTVLGNLFVANGGYIVQGFFGIAGLLTSFLFFKSFDGKKDVKPSHLVVAIVNRYIRLTPIVLVMVLFDSTWLAHITVGPLTEKVIYRERDYCRKNGWLNLLYLNNYFNKEEMCLQQTWYLAADTQVFVAALVVTYLMFKHRKHAIPIGLAAIAIGTAIPCMVSYYHDYEITTKHYPEPLWDILAKLDQWHVMFASGYNNVSSYMVGVLFGYLYFEHKRDNMLSNKIYVGLWWITVYSLPLLVVFSAAMFYPEDFHTTRFLASLYVGFGRTFYSFGILFAILGMAQGHGWVMKRILETDFCQVFGRISFCAYLVHVSLQRLRIGDLRSPVYLSNLQFIFQTVGDATISFLGGFILCLFFEMPISAIQKLYMPSSNDRVNQRNGDVMNNNQSNGNAVKHNNYPATKVNNEHKKLQ